MGRFQVSVVPESATDETRMKHGKEIECVGSAISLFLSSFHPCRIRVSSVAVCFLGTPEV
jgi:hypothetical protein